MEQNNRPPVQYSGTKGLSLAIVIGVALGTVIGKLMDNMQYGLMIGLVIAVCGWTLLINRRAKREGTSGNLDEGQNNTDEKKQQ